MLKLVEPMQTIFKRRYGTRLVFASDEFYIKAGQPFPSFSAYEDFPQIENGVGMIASFMKEVSRTRLPKRVHPVRATIVTGVSFQWRIAGAVAKASINRWRERAPCYR